MTYLNLVKAVLRRLRESDTITDVSDTEYATLIGDYVNEIKREVEDSWNWVQLRTSIQITTTSGTLRYTLTGAGDRFRILHVFNNTDDNDIHRASYKAMNRWLNQNNSTNNSPMYYDINGQTAGSPNIDFYPVPDSVYIIDVNMVKPQAELSANADELTVPDYPVLLGAYALAISERGDDSSTQYAEAHQRYQKALSDAIGIDSTGVRDELVWDVM